MAHPVPLAQIAVVKRDSQIPSAKPKKARAKARAREPEFDNDNELLKGDIGGTVTAGVLIISIFIGLLGTWVAMAPLEGAVVTTGVVKVVGNRKRLQHLDGGTVSEVLVKEGDLVQVDQLLVRLEDSQTRAAVAILTQQYDTNYAQQIRLLAERAGATTVAWPKELKDRIGDPDVASVLATQENLFQARRSALEGQVAVLRAKVSQLRQQISAYTALKSAQDQERYSIEDEVKGLRELFEKGFITRSRLLELERNATRLGGTAKDNAAQISRTLQAIEEAELQMVVLRNDRMTQISTDLRETETRLLDLLPRLQTARDSLARTEVRAPYSGRVIGLTVHAKGNVINRGDNILDIVPVNNELIVEAMVRVDDIKHVSVGQKAKVRLTAYTQRQLNMLDGVVELVSADRFTDTRTGAAFYSTNIRISDKALSDNPQIQLQPGMSATVMIETAARTTFDYLAQPIVESLSKALRGAAIRTMPAPSLDAAIGLHQQRRFAEAETLLREWLESHPGDAEGWLRLGNALIEQRQGDRALAAYQRHLAILPTSAIGHTAVGNLLLAADRLEQSIAFHRRAVTLKPDHTEGWHGLAVALGRDGQVDEAADAARRAVSLRANFTDARRYLATLLLMRGEVTEGLIERAAASPPSGPIWDGSVNPRSTLLVRADGDIAETLLFARFLEAARSRVGQLIVVCPLPLAGLLGRAAGVDRALAPPTPLPVYDLQAPLSDLPRILQIPATEMGRAKAYLGAEPGRAAALSARTAAEAKGRSKVGLADLPFTPTELQHQGAVFFALSPGAAAKNTIDLGVAEGDLEEMAAAIAGLDLVIAGDGPALRLAAALGVPVWAVLASPPDWPWMLGRPDSPWYPNARLFRQVGRGDWTGMAAEIARALAERNQGPAKPSAVAKQIETAKALHQQGRLAEAAALYRRGLASAPDNPELLHLLGLVCHQQGQSSIGIPLIERAVALLPKYPDAWNNLGIALRARGRTADAIASFEKAVKHHPKFADAYYNLGNARHANRDLKGAEAAYRHAIRIAPRHSGAHYNYGNLLRDQHRLKEAIAFYRKAIAISPENAEIHQSLALGLLLDGQYAEGFDALEWRWRTAGINRRDFTQPAWDGSPFRGQRLYAYGEQGLGDTLQFIRYIPEVKALGGEVIVEAQRSLLPLLARVPGIDRLVPVGDPPPPFDLHAPLMSLPRLLKTRLESIPARVPYLTGDPERIRRWRARLDGAAQGALKVGLVWAGSPAFRADRLRSPRLRACLPLFDIPFVHFFGLQMGDGRRDLEGQTMPAHFTDLGGEIADFEDSAAIIGGLDLLISSCTAPVHLAGALGAPTWVILPHVPDWRWMLGRSDSPWYPTVRLFRQTEPENWGPVVAEVAGALRALSEKSAIYLNNKANRLKESGGAEEALPLYRQAMAAAPNLPQIPYNFAIALEVLGRIPEAEAALRQGLALDPDHRALLINLGALLLRNGRAAEAAIAFEKVVARHPNDPQAYYNLGSALQALGRYEAALAAYDRALSLDSTMAMTINNKGACLRQLGRPEEAAEILARAAEDYPDLPEIHNNLGLVRKDLGQIAESVACHRRAVALQPDHADAHWNLALASLLSGDFEVGWREYEWRWQSKRTTTIQRSWPMPMWRGEPLAGRSLIVHCEQGFGDSMQFVRYLPVLTGQGARVILETSNALVRLFKSLDGVAELVTPDQPTPRADFHIPLLSLPWRMGTRLNTVPATVPYLHAAPDAVAAWKRRLADLKGLRVGLVWFGDRRHTDDHKRSAPLDVFAPVIGMTGTSWVSLQKGEGVSGQIAASGLRLRDLGPGLTDFADTAALIKALDLLISVDTSVVHAAGAMATPVWILLPSVPDFRWMMDRDDCPWYPSARLFRQPQRGAWTKLVENLGDALDRLMSIKN